MNINSASYLYSPLNVQTRENGVRPQDNNQNQQSSQNQQNNEIRPSADATSANQNASIRTDNADQNRRVESTEITNTRQSTQRTGEDLQNTAQANFEEDQGTDEISDVREARPEVINQQPNAATRTFLDIANQNDDFRIIDTFV